MADLELWHDAMYYRWEGTEMRSEHGSVFHVSVPAPENGSTGYMGYDWKEVTEQSQAEFVEVPYTVWGDYVGSTVERSNYRALLEDYPESFIDISGGYFSHVLYVRLNVLRENPDLLEHIQHLFDYPLYSEEDHSLLEMTIAEESWDSWLKSDVESALVNLEVDTDEWTEEDWQFVEGRFYQLTYEQNYGPECEDAVSCYFPFFDATVEELANELLTLGLEHDPRRPNPNQIEMQLNRKDV